MAALAGQPAPLLPRRRFDPVFDTLDLENAKGLITQMRQDAHNSNGPAVIRARHQLDNLYKYMSIKVWKEIGEFLDWVAQVSVVRPMQVVLTETEKDHKVFGRG